MLPDFTSTHVTVILVCKVFASGYSPKPSTYGGFLTSRCVSCESPHKYGPCKFTPSVWCVWCVWCICLFLADLWRLSPLASTNNLLHQTTEQWKVLFFLLPRILGFMPMSSWLFKKDQLGHILYQLVFKNPSWPPIENEIICFACLQARICPYRSIHAGNIRKPLALCQGKYRKQQMGTNSCKNWKTRPRLPIIHWNVMPPVRWLQICLFKLQSPYILCSVMFSCDSVVELFCGVARLAPVVHRRKHRPTALQPDEGQLVHPKVRAGTRAMRLGTCEDRDETKRIQKICNQSKTYEKRMLTHPFLVMFCCIVICLCSSYQVKLDAMTARINNCQMYLYIHISSYICI